MGRLVPEKGIRTLLESFAKLCERRDDVFLVFVGEQPHQVAGDWQRCAVDLGVNDRCVFTGATSRPEQYLAAIDLAVMPSEWDEPFGLTVIEAMACGTIAVVSDVGVLAQLVGKPAEQLTFQSKDSDALFMRIMLLLDLPAHSFKCIGDELRERAVNVFGADQSIGVYERLLVAND